MSTTPYKDELVRIGALLGLPDDTDPTEVAEAVDALVKRAAQDGALLEQAMKAGSDAQTKERAATDRAGNFQAALQGCEAQFRTIGQELANRRERAKSPQAYADMVEVGGMATSFADELARGAR